MIKKTRGILYTAREKEEEAENLLLSNRQLVLTIESEAIKDARKSKQVTPCGSAGENVKSFSGLSEFSGFLGVFGVLGMYCMLVHCRH